ncbi:MAG TPA: hypothetical protein VEH84_19565 [Alphaproteobacteria bacterium]|nr:hypothetical protein [Alphaproteobacteria bacterium]
MASAEGPRTLRRHRARRWALLALLAAGADASASSVAVYRHREVLTVSLSGPIVAATAGAVIEALGPPVGGAARLLVSGPGGDYGAMVALAGHLRSRPEIEVVAAGPCYSACAIIWASAPRRSLRPEATLGFHGESPCRRCPPGALTGRDAAVLAMIAETAPRLAQALAGRNPHALSLRDGHLAFFTAQDLAALGETILPR